jgi:tryptophanyl-tRNA synthetase
MNVTLAPIRERRQEILAKPDRVKEILVEGSRRARVTAQATMERVRDAVKLRY